jgi:hypothetical protein
VTHTYALLEISAPAYDEIAAKFRDAGYTHAFGEEGEIDMDGVAVIREEAEPTRDPLALVRGYLHFDEACKQIDAIMPPSIHPVKQQDVRALIDSCMDARCGLAMTKRTWARIHHAKRFICWIFGHRPGAYQKTRCVRCGEYL